MQLIEHFSISRTGKSIVYFNVLLGRSLLKKNYDALDLKQPTLEHYLKSFRPLYTAYIKNEDIIIITTADLNFDLQTTTKLNQIQLNKNVEQIPAIDSSDQTPSLAWLWVLVSCGCAVLVILVSLAIKLHCTNDLNKMKKISNFDDSSSSSSKKTPQLPDQSPTFVVQNKKLKDDLKNDVIIEEDGANEESFPSVRLPSSLVGLNDLRQAFNPLKKSEDFLKSRKENKTVIYTLQQQGIDGDLHIETTGTHNPVFSGNHSAVELLNSSVYLTRDIASLINNSSSKKNIENLTINAEKSTTRPIELNDKTVIINWDKQVLNINKTRKV
jgi:hypothetical protein